jgi:hypothetical protein
MQLLIDSLSAQKFKTAQHLRGLGLFNRRVFVTFQPPFSGIYPHIETRRQEIGKRENHTKLLS